MEHRYYGVSQPFEDLSTEHLTFLNSKQALADIAHFIQSYNKNLAEVYPLNTYQWVTIGGSYPGALSAWFKATYPDLTVAAWSSSGVIQPIKYFDTFDWDIYEATRKSG